MAQRTPVVGDRHPACRGTFALSLRGNLYGALLDNGPGRPAHAYSKEQRCLSLIEWFPLAHPS
jgi:hypothetical protein